MLRLLPILAFAGIAACTAEQAPLLVDNVTVARPLPGVPMSAGYLTLHNTTAQEIRITRVSSPQFAAVEMHESVSEDGIARMHELQEIVVPPAGSVVFEPGAKHLMLRAPIGEPELVTLQFFASDALLLSIDVKPGEPN